VDGRMMEHYLQAIEFIITPQHYSTLPRLALALLNSLNSLIIDSTGLWEERSMFSLCSPGI